MLDKNIRQAKTLQPVSPAIVSNDSREDEIPDSIIELGPENKNLGIAESTIGHSKAMQEED